MRFSARPRWSIRSAIGVLLFLITGAVSYGADRSYEEGLIARVEATFGAETRTAAGTAPEAGGVIKCGTPLAYEIRMSWPNLSESARKKIAVLVRHERPTLDEYYDHDMPGGHFRIHFTRTGKNSVNMTFGVGPGNVPNYVLRCAAFLDTVVQTEVTTLGYRFPVSDQEGRPQEDPRYDIYMTDIGGQVYGMAWIDTTLFRPDVNVYWATSWMEISNDYTQLPWYQDRPFDAMAVTLAHEFFHAVQYTYDAFEAEYRDAHLSEPCCFYSWFHELSSTWMEDVVFDRVNDYRFYLPNFLHYPWLSLRVFRGSNTEQQHPYASCLWGKFVTERYDINVMRDIWERCGAKAGFNTFDAFDWALNKRGTSFASAWAEFLVWNYFTGSRWRSWSYQEGADFPLHRPGLPDFDGQISDSLVAYHSGFPVEDSTSPSRPAYNSDELGGTYISFLPPPPSDTAVDFHFQMTPDDFDQWMIVTAGIKAAGKPDISYRTDIFEPATVPNWTEYNEVLVVVSPFKSTPTQDVLDRNLSFHYAVRDTFESQKGISTTVYSNPLVLGASGESPRFQVDVSLEKSLPVSMHVYTVDGILVRGAPDPGMSHAAGSRRVSLLWDGTNRDRKAVASGVYLALVQIGDKREVIKIAVRNDR